MKRKIFAVVLGVIAAVVLIITIEALGHSLYPLPAGMDVTDTESMKAYVHDVAGYRIADRHGRVDCCDTGRWASCLFYRPRNAAHLFSHYWRPGPPGNDHQPDVPPASFVVLNHFRTGHHRDDIHHRPNWFVFCVYNSS